MTGTVKFLFDNWLDLEILANSDVSSEQSAFPIENAYNANRRSKEWRSNGYFRVNAGANDIVFREEIGGPDLVASIAPGHYNSTTAFIAAVKAAFDAAGASTYTISHNGNYRFVFTSNGVGGDGIFEMLTTDAGSTGVGLLGLDDETDYTGALTYTADEMKIHTSEWILWDMAIESNPNFFGLIQERNKPINITPSAVMTLKGNPTNPADWSSPFFETTLEYNEQIITKVQELVFANQATRYWRFEITDQNPIGYIKAGAFGLGVLYFPVDGKPQFPYQLTPVDRSTTVTSEGGQTFSDVLEKTATHRFTYRFMSIQDKEDMEFNFDRFGTSKPFFVVIDQFEHIHSLVNRSIKYVKFADEPVFTIETPGKYNMSVNLREEL